jgi:hypothetical protein
MTAKQPEESLVAEVLDKKDKLAKFLEDCDCLLDEVDPDHECQPQTFTFRESEEPASGG